MSTKKFVQVKRHIILRAIILPFEQLHVLTSSTTFERLGDPPTSSFRGSTLSASRPSKRGRNIARWNPVARLYERAT